MNHSTPGLPVHHQLPGFTQTHVHQLVMPSSHLILCCPLLFLPPIPPSIRAFSNESALRIRWQKYWSFTFNVSPSNEHLGLISFRMDWLDLLVPPYSSAILHYPILQWQNGLLFQHSDVIYDFPCKLFAMIFRNKRDHWTVPLLKYSTGFLEASLLLRKQKHFVWRELFCGYTNQF